MEAFLTDYWPMVLAVLPVLAKGLNKVTPKWGDVSNKVYRVALLVVEVLDVLRKPTDYRKSIGG